MKRFIKLLFSFYGFCFMSGILSAQLAKYGDVHPVVAFIVSFIAMFLLIAFRHHLPRVRSASGSQPVKAGVNVEHWVDYIIQRLRKDNQFLSYATDESRYVVGGSVVHIPQPGSKPVVRKNRTTYPAAAVKRQDTDVVYVLDEYTTDPTHITNAEEVELSYDKQNDVLNDHMETLGEIIGDDMVYRWANLIPAAAIVRSTGAAVAASVPGQTGNRKKLTPADVKKCQKVMNLQNVPKTDRYMLLEENMYQELTDALTETQERDFSKYFDAENGILGRLYGFNIMTRSSVAMAAVNLNGSSELVVNPVDAAVGATDLTVSIAWQKGCVAAAVGSTEFFENVKDATYYGDVYSALRRTGGRRRRADNAGVIALVQDTAA